MITQLTESNPDIASWEDGGKTFVVYDRDRLAKEVIPNYFKHNQYSSFMRSLNSYKFTKQPVEFKGKLWHRYSHNGFVRGKPELLPFVHQSLPSQKHKVVALSATRRTIGELLTENENLIRRVAELEAELQVLDHRTSANYAATASSAQVQSASFIPENRSHTMKYILDKKKRKATESELDPSHIIKKIASEPYSILRISSASGGRMDFKPIPLPNGAGSSSYPTTPAGSLDTNSFINNDPPRRITRNQSRQLALKNITCNRPSGATRIASISFSNTDEVQVLPGPSTTNSRLQKPKPLFFPTESQDHLFLELMQSEMLNTDDDCDDASVSLSRLEGM